MVNKQNLRPVQSKEEARERGRKGGIKSGEARRARKTLKEELLMLLSTGNTQEKISAALIKQAKDGNTRAYEVIRDTIGEKVADNLQVSGTINNPFEGMSTEELRKIVDGK